MKFDQHVANYHRQLNEAAIGDFFRALTKNPEKLQQIVIPAFRLENPAKNLPVMYQKLKIEQLGQTLNQQQLGDAINPITGAIDNDKFSMIMYEAFSRSRNGIVTVDDLARSNIGGGKNRLQHLGKTPPYDHAKVANAITEFINKQGLSNIIRMYKSYEDAQKGSKATQLGSAIQKGAINIGKQALNMATKQGMVEI